MRFAAPLLVLIALFATPGLAGDPPGFQDRPGLGQPLRYTDINENVFRPRRLVIVTPSGIYAATLPANARESRFEDRLDLSGLPLVGGLFRPRLAPQDATREGMRLGPVTRFGDTIVVDAGATAVTPGNLRIVLTANFPRDGAVSHWLGTLQFAPAAAPAGAARAAGSAYIVDDTMVLAGPGFEPRITDWNTLFR